MQRTTGLIVVAALASACGSSDGNRKPGPRDPVSDAAAGGRSSTGGAPSAGGAGGAAGGGGSSGNDDAGSGGAPLDAGSGGSGGAGAGGQPVPDAAPADASADAADATVPPPDASVDATRDGDIDATPDGSLALCAPPSIDPSDVADAGTAYTGPAPTLYWSFDQADVAGSTVADSSSNSIDGTIHGGVATGAAGIAGEAVRLDGSTGYIDGDLPKSSLVTVSLWVNPSAYATGAGLIAANLGNGPNTWTGWLTGVRNDGRHRWTVEGGTGTLELYADTTDCIPLGAWTHVVGTFDGSFSRIYRDGVLQAETPIPYSTIAFGTRPLVVGRHSYFNNRYWNGLIDELAVWNQVLSPRQVVQLFRLGKAGQRVAP